MQEGGLRAALLLLTKLETIPQRLKPSPDWWTYGTDKSVPFQDCDLFLASCMAVHSQSERTCLEQSDREEEIADWPGTDWTLRMERCWLTLK
jgi:hypothetical protein